MYLSAWEAQLDRRDLGEQVFLHAVVVWDLGVMVMSSRKMFNLVKSAVWARVAAWSEWVNVRVLKCIHLVWQISYTDFELMWVQ